MASLSSLGLLCDLQAAPWDYPGHRAPHPGLLRGADYHRLDTRPGGTFDDVLAADGVAPLCRRTLIVAVGSNASPDVMRRKFAHAGVSGVVPFITVTLDGIGVGHSAHVSRAGYIAATPFHSPGATGTFVASLLDDDQLACLDDTERTYTRRPVAVRVDAVARPAWLYESDRGVLAGAPGGAVHLPFTTQADLARRLIAGDGGLRRRWGDAPGTNVVAAALAADAVHRDAVTHRLSAWAIDSGLAARRSAARVEAGEGLAVGEAGGAAGVGQPGFDS